MLLRLFSSLIMAALCLGSVSADEPENPLWSLVEMEDSAPPAIGPEDEVPLENPEDPPMQAMSLSVPAAVEAEIVELAETLGNDPVRIFNYVRNEIDYDHYFGLRKGSVLTLLEGSGNDFDQCELLADLLRAAGYTDIRYLIRGQRISFSDFKDWIGFAAEPFPGKTYFQAYGRNITDDYHSGQDNGVGDLVAKQATFCGSAIASGGSRSSVGGAAVWYPDFPTKATVVWDRMSLSVNVGGTRYELDPSYKTYEKIPSLDLLAAAGYVRDDIIAAAGGGTNVDYAQGLDDAAIRSFMANLTHDLLDEIAENYPGLSVRELVGGRRIIKHDITSLNDAFPLPRVWFGTNIDETFIPDNYKSKIRFQAGSMDHTENMADLKGRKVSLTFSGNTVELRLDDADPVATASISAAQFNMTLTASHPGGQGNMSESKVYQKNNNFAYAILYGFSPSGKLLQKRYEQLASYKADGKADDSREVRTELLNIMGATWLYQTHLAESILAAKNDMVGCSIHRFGRMGQEQGFYVDVGLQRTYMRPDDGDLSTGRMDNVFHLGSLYASAMEHGIIEQMQPGTSAVSTVNIIRTANAITNNTNKRIYLAHAGNWTAVRAQLNSGGYPAAKLDDFANYFNPSHANYAPETKLLLPRSYSVRPKLPNGNNGNWIGSGWVIRKDDEAGMIISGGYSGGYSYWGGGGNNYVSSPPIYTGSYYNPTYSYTPSYSYSSSYVPPSFSTPSFFGSDPVNMATGSFEYSHTDMETGIEAAPRGLGFTRNYSSARATEERQNIGYGWSHSLHIRAAKRTASEESLGLGTVQQAASFLTSMMVASDLYRSDASVQEWGTTALIVGWYLDQLNNNAVSVTIGGNTVQFIKQPDGTYQPPAGSTMSLEIVSNNIRVSQRHGNTMFFQDTQSSDDESQRIQKIADPDGKEMTFVYHNDDRINYVQDCYGRRYTFGYTGTRITSITDSTNTGATRSVGFRFDGEGNLDRVTDPEGKFYYFDYEVPGDPGGTVAADHRIVRMRNHDGNAITQNVYDPLGRVTEQFLHGDTNKTWKLRYTGTENTEENPEGGVTTYFYDERGRSIGKRDPSGVTESWAYDGQDQIVEKTTGSGETTIYHYDARHNLTQIDHPRGGGSTQMFYDSLDRLDLVIDPDLKETDYVYNSGNTKARPDQIIDPEGTTSYQYKTSGAAIGRVWKVTDNDNLLTEYEYDSYGHPDWIKAPGGFQTQYTYTARGDLLDTTDPNLVVTSYEYNARRQVTKITSDDGGANESVEDFAYNNQGLLERKTEAADNGGQRFATRYEYSPTEKQRFVRTSDNDGEGPNDPYTEIAYDGRDWQSQSLDPASRLTIFTPQANGQPWKTTIPLSREKIQLQDGDGRPTGGVVPGSSGTRSSSIVYDVAPSGYPRTVTTTADNLSVNEVQDRRGNPRFYTNRKTNVWEFRYDGLGRRTHVITPLDAAASRAQVTEYSHRGTVKKFTEPSGQVSNFTYDPTSGRLTGVTDGVGTISHTAYDNNGNLLTTTETRTGTPGTKTTTRTYDRQDRLKSRTDENSQTIGYRYYPSGKLWKIIYPGGSESGTGHVEYTWWQSGQLKDVIDKLDSTSSPRTTSYFWNKDGRLAKVQRDNGTIREVKYDAAGRPDVIEEYGPDMKLIFVHKYGFYPSDEMAWRYTLPAKRTSGNDPPAMLAMTYNADNQLATWGGQTIIHDADGNMTTGPAPDGSSLASYSYDTRNRLVSALGTTYTYDADGQRVGMVNGADTTTFVTDVSSRLSKLLVRTKNGVSTRYVWGLGLLYEVNGSGGSATTVSYHHDATGSTIALSDDTGKVIERIGYTPWGQINHRANLGGTPHDTPFLFTGFFGNQTDGNGLLYMRARYYHPQLGRFLNADPAQEGMNWYGYAGGNPIGMVDPMGLGIESVLDSVQTVLSFLGMTPVFGAVFDVVNAGISIGRGNYVDAAMNLASAIPGIGDFAMGAKLIGGGAASYASLSLIGARWVDNAATLGKYEVGAYNVLRKGAATGLDAHHVGQKAVMSKLIPGYNAYTAPSILVPSLGHTVGSGVVSRTTTGFTSARQVVARDIRELRRVYPDIPNTQLKTLIDLNKSMYPSAFQKIATP
ncbi:RHS repeat-associated core domain-containing protein [Haloferula sargassicola]|uniref:RHS repeat-associated core domain-containing protein n=1 Tax=Haloferula sargassicola TaxID=490096 RepID=A0ABP9UQW7_9BACT